ncbi:MAG: 3-hydroxyacyl-CoA dehydrogenase [Rickettsiales bacterium]|nr:3-hydroxyacyl-CoA dehydrogenase [Rickettsiales bacterium]
MALRPSALTLRAEPAVDVSVYDPKLVAVVGAGNMGAGIAQKIAQEGYSVLLADVDLERAERGRAIIETSLHQAVERRIVSKAQRAETLSRITAVGSLELLAEADLVIEAIFEDLAAKRQLFQQLDRCVGPNCVLATNTSSFYVEQLAEVTERPELVVGLHYFFHPAKNRLLEVIAGQHTLPEVIAAMVRFAEGHGKTALQVADRPGFAVNRFFVPWLNEAVRLVHEGLADRPSVEAAAKRAFGVGMGPFQLMNVTGLPVGLHAASTLGRELGPFYEPCQLLAQQVAVGSMWSFAGEADTSVQVQIQERLLASVFLVVGQLLDEQVCSLEDVDRGARIGLRWTKGPFELLAEVGIERAVELVERLVVSHPELVVPRSLRDQASLGRPFGFQRVDLEVDQGIATVRINRPEVLNALDEQLVAQLHDVLEQAMGIEGLQGIVLAGAGKAFVAGADISFFVRNLEADDVDRILTFTRKGQALLRLIETCTVPVIARVHGMALGGGTELALACHGIVCSDRASFALPETGIGIYPGLGGTQRLPRIVGPELARRLIFTGKPLSAVSAVEAGLALQCVPIQDLDRAVREWFACGLPDRYAVEGQPGAAVREAYAASAVQSLLEGRLPDQISGEARTLLEGDLRAIGRKAPLALAAAAQLIDDGAALQLPAALELELDRLEGIFTTKDALHGLKSVTSGSRPSWQSA